MPDPFVSIIIPTYNRGYILCRAVDSVLSQTYKRRELIVVDDGSTDDTQAHLSQYGDQIRHVRQRNSGPSVARNRGISAARGDIVAFLDSDDYWQPTKLERQVMALEAAGDGIPCCLTNCGYEGDPDTSTFAIADVMPSCAVGVWTNPALVLATRPVIFTQAVAVRRKSLERVGAFDEALPFFCEDHDLALRLALEGPWVVIRDELVVCRGGGADSLGERALRDLVRLRKDQVKMRQHFLELVTGNPRHAVLRRPARRALQRARLQLLEAELRTKRVRVATAAAWLLGTMAWLGAVVFRRSPLYPRVRVRPLVYSSIGS